MAVLGRVRAGVVEAFRRRLNCLIRTGGDVGGGGGLSRAREVAEVRAWRPRACQGPRMEAIEDLGACVCVCLCVCVCGWLWARAREYNGCGCEWVRGV